MENLNESQKQAVMYNDSSSLIIAGAGSGKTRVLTYKIAFLLQQGVDPCKIMALTFTNKAAKEMKERIAQLVGVELANKINMGTFHSVFARILQYECYYIGWNSKFSIYDEADSRSLLKEIIKELGLENDKYKPANIHARISMAKNNLIEPKQYAENQKFTDEDKISKIPMLASIYRIYQERLKLANAMDFDDLLFNIYKVFQNKVVLADYQNRYDYVLVDEFQDTNYAQMQILLLLCQAKNNLYAVGDDAQSIYAFRGANINNILSFQMSFPQSKIFKLERNYRSTQNIVAAANSLINQNSFQIPKHVYSQENIGDKVHYNELLTDRLEAKFVADIIKNKVLQSKYNYTDFAILYRNNALSRCIEEMMMQENIPYNIYGSISFFQRKEVKDVMSYFRLACNCDDNEAFKRIINFPQRGIGAITIQKIKDRATYFNVPMLHIISNPQSFGLKVSKKTEMTLVDFADKIMKWTMRVYDIKADDFADGILTDFGIYDYMKNQETDGIGKINNVNEIFSSIDAFITLRKEENRLDEIYINNYIQDVALVADENQTEDTDKVNLMTIHGSKGLEFKNVFIIGAEEGIFPNNRTASSELELEEERRLMYVAITRAEESCYITCAKKRWLYGEEQQNKPSRFVNDIDAKYIDDMTEEREEDDQYDNCLFV